MNELDIKFIFLEVDYAIYTRVLDDMFRWKQKDLKYSRKLSHVWVLAWHLHAKDNWQTI